MRAQRHGRPGRGRTQLAERPTPGRQPDRPAILLRHDRRSSWIGAAFSGAIIALTALPSLALGLVSGSVAAKLITGWAGWPVPGDYRALARDRMYQITWGTFGSPPLLIASLAILPGLLIATLVFLTRAWPRFTITRLWLAISGRLPWRYSLFMADARARNLLRQAGGAYQFRHMRLQEHLVHHARNHPVQYRSKEARTQAKRALVATVAVVAVLAVYAVNRVPRDTSIEVLAGEHSFGPVDVSTSPDGRLLMVTSRRDGIIAIKNPTSGTDLQLPPKMPSDRRLTRTEFSPNSRLLVFKTRPVAPAKGRR